MLSVGLGAFKGPILKQRPCHSCHSASAFILTQSHWLWANSPGPSLWGRLTDWSVLVEEGPWAVLQQSEHLHLFPEEIHGIDEAENMGPINLNMKVRLAQRLCLGTPVPVPDI
ncbi:hypothetical protein AK812_SmicGene24038 [Symbiodinium microadriaticum]|uniref:Uncharacterized protein n=1 Tax=Symbiodinium microadriaticum TaxID=2951 RepID=A0A1Q9DFR9_SYMMI|nr:hypothetical protein AK812_SmicGene24038 [Symbiodinium microadriaticum]